MGTTTPVRFRFPVTVETKQQTSKHERRPGATTPGLIRIALVRKLNYFRSVLPETTSVYADMPPALKARTR